MHVPLSSHCVLYKFIGIGNYLKYNHLFAANMAVPYDCFSSATKYVARINQQRPKTALIKWISEDLLQLQDTSQSLYNKPLYRFGSHIVMLWLICFVPWNFTKMIIFPIILCKIVPLQHNSEHCPFLWIPNLLL